MHVCALAVLMFALGAVELPAYVGSPGLHRLAVGVGLDGTAPAADLRFGLLPFMSVTAEGVWHPTAPLVGGAIRLAAGRARQLLSAHAWLEGHVRPVISTDVTRPVAGGDVGLGVGVDITPSIFIVRLDGGMGLGIPVFDVVFDDLDEDAVDQQGGLFALQRVLVAADIGDHLELAAHGAVAIPVGSVRFDRGEDELLGRWDVRIGGRIIVRM